MNSIKTDRTSGADIILIADSPQDKILLTQMLSDNGYQLRQASTADLAFAAVKIKKPDLFIVSDQVAGIDGFEICGMLKTAPETKAIPIIMVVESEQSKRKITRSQFNRIDFVARPYQQDDILIRVQNNLTMHYLYKELAQRNRSLLKEIDGHEQAELMLQLERDRLQTMLQAIGDGVIYTDTAATVTLMNEAAKSFTGWLMEDAIGQPVEKVFKLVKENTREKYEDLVKNVLEAGRPYDVESGALVVSKDGNETPVDVSITPVYLRKGIIDGVAVVFRDYVKEKKKLKNRVFLDHYDQINGRYSRRNSDNELRRLGDNKYLPLSFVVVDVNGLGRTNNSFGAKYSGLMLRKIANILKTECRPDDIVVRIGESKFVIFVPSTDAKYADLMIARLNKAVEKQSIRNVIFTLSVDFSLDGDIYEDIDILLKNAEEEVCRYVKADGMGIKSRVVFIVMNALYDNNITERAHSHAVSMHCAAIAKAIGLSEREIWQVKLAGMLHDIGKIGVNELILDSKGRLTEQERKEVKKHAETGYQILKSSYEFSDAAEFVLEHHERWDGKGYPRGLRGKEISVQARIIAVADTYDDIVSERAYKPKLHKEDAIKELERCAGTQFDPEVVKVFLEKVIGEKRQS